MVIDCAPRVTFLSFYRRHEPEKTLTLEEAVLVSKTKSLFQVDSIRMRPAEASMDNVVTI